MAQSNSNKPPQAIVPYGPVAGPGGARNGNRRREPMEEGRQEKNGNKNAGVVLATLFVTKRLEWECNYCLMVYDGNGFSKRLPGRPGSIPLTEKELQNFKFAIRAAAKKTLRSSAS